MARWQRWMISIGLFALFGAIALHTPFMNSSTIQTQAALKTKATQALRVSNQADWASVDIHGQTAHLKGLAPDANARAEAILAVASATGKKGPIVGGIANVSDDQVRMTPEPKLQQPFRFRAFNEQSLLKYEYHVPSKDFKNRLDRFAQSNFPGASRVYNQTVLALGQPDDSWSQAIITGLLGLSALESGTLFSQDSLLKLTGSSNQISEMELRDTLIDLPSGYTIEADLTLLGEPILFTINGTAGPRDLDSIASTLVLDKTDLSDATTSDDLEISDLPGSKDSDLTGANKPFNTGLSNATDGLHETSDTSAVATSEIAKTGNESIPSKAKPDLAGQSKVKGMDLRVPSPSQVGSGPDFSNLPPAPKPKDAFDVEVIDRSPLEIQPRNLRAPVAPKSLPKLKKPLAQDTQNAAARSIVLRDDPVPEPSLNKPSVRNTSTSTHQSISRNDLATSAATQYIPAPRRRETTIAAHTRDCQNQVIMMMKYSTIRFYPGSTRITPESRPLLAGLADTLSRCKTQTIDIVGHTDNTGDELNNLRLSKQRAETVVQIFADMGIDRSNLKAAGLGSSRPIALNDTPKGQKKNTRIEIIISDRQDG